MDAKNKNIRIYTDQKGQAPFSKWMKSIKAPIIRARLDRLNLGNYVSKSVGNGVSELRLASGSGYRVYYADLDDVIVILLCGGR